MLSIVYDWPLYRPNQIVTFIKLFAENVENPQISFLQATNSEA